MSPSLLRLQLRTTRTATAVWTATEGALGAATVTGYVTTYPTAAARAVVASQISGNPGFQALYGRARDLGSTGGFTAWRVGGLMVVIAAAWGALSTVRALRGDEELGRADLIVASPVSRRRWYADAVTATSINQVVASTGLWVALVACGLAPGGSALVAVGIATCGLVGVALGAVAAQLAATRRRAAVWVGSAIGLAYLVRVLADGSRSLDALRWATPFGWAEEIRAFAGARLWPLGLLAAAAVVCHLGATALLIRRDLGAAVFADRAIGPASSARLRGPTSLAWRLGARSIAAWSAAMAAASAVMGLLSVDVASFVARSPGYVRVARELGIDHPDRPVAFIGLAFSFLVVPLALYAATQAGATRDEEADGRADPIFVQPVGRLRWLLGRVAVVTLGLVVVASSMAFGAWVGVAARGGEMSLPDAARGAANLVPLVVLVLGVATLAHGVAPRSTTAAGVGFVVAGYAVQLVGALVHAPWWVLDLSPFHHLAVVPSTSAALEPLVVEGALGLAAIVLGAQAFRRRDLVGA